MKMSEDRYPNILIYEDCVHFGNDRPCDIHKKTGVKCSNCTEYEKKGPRILIVKLGAIGDVLRTTAILPNLHADYLCPQIFWVTRRDALPLFKNNFMIKKVIDAGSDECLITLLTEEYDLSINLDTSPESARLSEIISAKRKIGFGYAKEGYVYPLNPESRKWFLMGLFDDLKKANRQSYQELMLEICWAKDRRLYEPILILDDKDRVKAARFYKDHYISHHKPIVGVNTGGGERWQNKKWTERHILEFCRLMKEHFPRAKVLLYGGPKEAKRHKSLLIKAPNNVLDTGCNHGLREFAAFVELCDVMVTGDTLAMHIAIALNKYTVVLFGPTSYREIHLYDRGTKIVPDLDCLACYRNTCDKHPSCMELIKPDTLVENIRFLFSHENITR
jgi:heptosyltransferase-2